jgi:carbonic anhydrase/acetyltransferase-like protein (isoleucine patch superfamily)
VNRQRGDSTLLLLTAVCEVVMLTVPRAFTFYPVKISDFVHIGPNCIIEAAQIGGGVEIGEGSIIVSACPRVNVRSSWSRSSVNVLVRSGSPAKGRYDLST